MCKIGYQDLVKIEDPEKLAREFLNLYFDQEKPSIPIDPFEMLKKFGIIYQFKDFKELEGIYLPPEDDTDIAVVGINNRRPVTRQRFTAAHEICHHIKDRISKALCPIGNKSMAEKFADVFASAVLMPLKELIEQTEQFEKDGYVSFEDIVFISDYFAVSFESCVFRIAYMLNKIEGDITPKVLKSKIRKIKPDIKRRELGLGSHELEVLVKIINSYSYFIPQKNRATWYKFKNNFVYNENRVEGIELEHEQISDIVTDLRLRKQDSLFCSTENQEIIEVAGHASLYDYLLDTADNISIFKMLNLNKMLFQYAPFTEHAGATRTSNNLVIGAKFETVDYREIPNKLLELEKELIKLLDIKDNLALNTYIERAVQIHHEITVIHPFRDGNGRVSRVMLNWLFKIKDLPPVYINFDRKEDYFDALREADINHNYEKLNLFFLKSIIYSLIELNEGFVL